VILNSPLVEIIGDAVMKAAKFLSVLILFGSVLLLSAEAFAKDRTKGRGTGPVVYVTSQGL
jgi:hypothetical protein